MVNTNESVDTLPKLRRTNEVASTIHDENEVCFVSTAEYDFVI